MLTIICGEDIIASRDYFNKLKYDYQNKDYEIQYINPQNISDLSNLTAQSPSLFAQKRLYITDNLLRKWKGKIPDAPILDWEEKSLYELKIPKGATTKEFKLPISIFKLLDSCYPGNLKSFINILHGLSQKIDGGFIFIMLARYMRNIFLLKSGQNVPKLRSWQIAKLKMQAKYWSLQKLSAFYEGLYRIDVSSKTSTNPYDIRKSLDILACYIL